MHLKPARKGRPLSNVCSTSRDFIEMSGNPGGLNGSMQHWFEAHLAEFKRPNPLAGGDSKKNPVLFRSN
jgi:hypothetical protein